jgi:hypothetical protein
MTAEEHCVIVGASSVHNFLDLLKNCCSYVSYTWYKQTRPNEINLFCNWIWICLVNRIMSKYKKRWLFWLHWYKCKCLLGNSIILSQYCVSQREVSGQCILKLLKSFHLFQVFMEDPGLQNREKICSKSKLYNIKCGIICFISVIWDALPNMKYMAPWLLLLLIIRNDRLQDHLSRQVFCDCSWFSSKRN